MYTYVHFWQHPRLPRDSVRHGWRSVPSEGERSINGTDHVHQLHIQLHHGEDVSRYGAGYG